MSNTEYKAALHEQLRDPHAYLERVEIQTNITEHVLVTHGLIWEENTKRHRDAMASGTTPSR